MKVTEKLVTKDHSKLVSAILADQVNRHQQLLLTWECPDVETAGMVERFIRHFDTPVACVEKRVEFSLTVSILPYFPRVCNAFPAPFPKRSNSAGERAVGERPRINCFS